MKKKNTTITIILALLVCFLCCFSACDEKQAENSDSDNVPSYTLSVYDLSLIVGMEYKPDFSLKRDGIEVREASFDYQCVTDGVVSVSNGKLYAEALGLATLNVIASVNGEALAEASFTCKVNKNEGIHPVKSSYTLYVTEKVKDASYDVSTSLDAFVYCNGEILSDTNIEWTVGNENVAKIDGNGRLTAVSEGETYIVGSYAINAAEVLKTIELSVFVKIPVLSTRDDIIIDKERNVQVFDAQSILGVDVVESLFLPSTNMEYSITDNSISTAFFKVGEQDCVFYSKGKTFGVEVNLVVADFVIYDKEDLLQLPDLERGYVVLANDISGVDYVNDLNKVFSGTLNGLGHKISDINFKSAGSGLFANVNGATIKNIAVVNAVLEKASSGVFFYRSLASKNTVDNTYAQVQWDSTVWTVGGAFGFIFRGTVNYTNSILIAGGDNMGSNGLISGRCNTQTNINNCYVIGNGVLCGVMGNENSNYALINQLAGVSYATEDELSVAIVKGKTDFSGFNKYWDFSDNIPRM